MMASTAPSTRPSVSESALEFLMLEAVRVYHEKGEAGRRALEAMGYQVGTQLAERFVHPNPAPLRVRFPSRPRFLPSSPLPVVATLTPPRRSRPHRRYTKDRARFTEPTEIILYLCKEFWPDVFKKRVDNLKTNNRGVYVLTDNAFRWVHHLHAVGPSREAGEAAKREYAETCARFPAGIVRGALANLGTPCVVVAECDPPSCVFTVRLRGAAP